MSEFVNFNKRNISLPAGCKDLLDVLKHTGSAAKITTDDWSTEKLHDIAKWISAVLESKALLAKFALFSLDNRLSLHIFQINGETLDTSVGYTRSSENEQKMRAIFQHAGLQAPSDSAVIKGQRVQLSFRIRPEPVRAVELTKVASLIFQEFCGLEPSSGVRVHLSEVTNAT